MRKPRALSSGDRIAVVAPASAFKRDEFDRGIEEIRRLGFEPVYDESVFDRQRYVAGAARTRAAAIRAAWEDRSIAAVIGVRGGYGSAQVLPLLDQTLAREAAKPFIGYSDVTSILTFLTVTCGVVAFHGPMLAGRLGRGEAGYDRPSLVNALTQPVPVGALTAAGLEAIRAGEATGPLYGGTMTQLLASLGTPYAFAPPPGCVLFLEDVAERPYKLDRMVTQFRQAGILSRACAVIIGELPDCDEPGGDPTARAVMADLFSDFPGPVLIGFPSGHTSGPAMTLPLGVAVRVVGAPSPAVVVEESAVR